MNPYIKGTYFDTNARGTSAKNTIPTKSIMMADLTYFNHVPTPDQIKTMYANGFTQNYASAYASPKTGGSDPANAFMRNVSQGIGAQSLPTIGESSI
jgi:hypothetical protein